MGGYPALDGSARQGGGVISGRMCHDPPGRFYVTECHHGIAGASGFECRAMLKILTLQPQPLRGTSGQTDDVQHGSLPNKCANSVAGPLNVGETD